MPNASSWLDTYKIKYLAGGTKTKSLYIRLGPSPDFESPGRIRENERLYVLAEEFGFSYLVTEDGRSGWCNNDYLTEEVPASVKDGNVQMPKDDEWLSVGRTMHIYSEGGLYMRSGPSSDYKKLDTVAKNEAICVVAKSGEFYFAVASNGRSGWFNEKYLVD